MVYLLLLLRYPMLDCWSFCLIWKPLRDDKGCGGLLPVPVIWFWPFPYSSYWNDLAVSIFYAVWFGLPSILSLSFWKLKEAVLIGVLMLCFGELTKLGSLGDLWSVSLKTSVIDYRLSRGTFPLFLDFLIYSFPTSSSSNFLSVLKLVEKFLIISGSLP